MSTTVSAAATRPVEHHHSTEPAKAAPPAKHEAPHHETASKPAEHVGKKVDVKA